VTESSAPLAGFVSSVCSSVWSNRSLMARHQATARDRPKCGVGAPLTLDGRRDRHTADCGTCAGRTVAAVLSRRPPKQNPTCAQAGHFAQACPHIRPREWLPGISPPHSSTGCFRSKAISLT
jgi:hypothetical protein